MVGIIAWLCIIIVPLGILSIITAAAFAGTDPTAKADDEWRQDFRASTDKAIAELRNR